ncbi:MAG: Cell division inhibitor [uncultured Solirubrobacteraceae bacterium]|uniref:Cell division inhibitor n=1 Tax=uncultured Solirubrobacteraceae bacterium TaxID=1162706 RepID=A0A6J4TMN5_9ACTN|nr:MAG: Cell division inhibitor [uncultured Solirubrobacteraceae bacterium]
MSCAGPRAYPSGLPATKLTLEVGAILMRTESELILKSRRVIPGVLLGRGSSFHVPDWPTAARQLCADRRSGGR